MQKHERFAASIGTRKKTRDILELPPRGHLFNPSRIAGKVQEGQVFRLVTSEVQGVQTLANPDQSDASISTRARIGYALWLAVILAFAVLTALHLRADFPNNSPWTFDWAKYTDEGWYGNAAVRAHLLGHWHVAGDFNPAAALPVLPFLEWLLFFFTGVSPQAARGLDVAFFFASLLLTYRLVREKGTRWAGLMAVTLMVTSPFLYSFSRLAILEPVLIALTLAALNIAVRMPKMRRPLLISVGLGVLFAVMMLTKTTAIFLIPAPLWALAVSMRQERKPVVGCLLAAVGTAIAGYGLWLAMVVRLGLLADYRYLFFVNAYPKPNQVYWPLVAAFWSFHGGLWADRVLMPLAVVVGLAAALAWIMRGRGLMADSLFGASIVASTGYVLFMTFQNHPQPRYFTVVAVFSFIQLTRGMEVLVSRTERGLYTHPRFERVVGWAVLVATVAAVGVNGVRTLQYALHPSYTFVNAAQQLTAFIDAHPNGNRQLMSISGDEISLITHLPSLCDDFGTTDLSTKSGSYKPGWYAAWNDLDPGTLASLHTHFSLEQVASFPAFDDPDRNVLVLFKLHPLPARSENLTEPLPDDRIYIPAE
jgi:hypothetical protein